MNTIDPDQIEVAPGVVHEKLEGTVWQAATDDDLLEALEKAFDYRGDVTISRRDGASVEGYIFDRRKGTTLADSYVRVIPKNQREKVRINYSEISALSFTGRDPAAGKSWEAWMKKYQERKAAGEKQIALEPENLD